jgi:hypothetical protein
LRSDAAGRTGDGTATGAAAAGFSGALEGPVGAEEFELMSSKAFRRACTAFSASFS